MRDGARRGVAAGVVVAFVAAGGFVDAHVGRSTAPALAAPATQRASAVASASAESSAWYCAGGGKAGGAPVTVVLANSTGRAVSGTLTAVPLGARPSAVAVTVAPYSVDSVDPSQLTSGGWVAASVSLNGGGVAVSETVSGSFGWASAPCASATSTSWFFPHASTATGDFAMVSLFNPTDTPADVDVSLLTSSSGLVEPPDYQEVALAPQSLVVLSLGDHDLGDPSLATEVTTLSGTIVAAQLQVDTVAGQAGISLELGSAPSRTWHFAQSTDTSGASVLYHVLNPSTRPVTVTLRLGLQQGSAAPIVFHVPGLTSRILDAGTQTRIPPQVAYSATFSSDGPRGIVVSRQVDAASDGPSPQFGETPGQSSIGQRWMVGPVTSPGTGPWSLSIMSPPGSRTVSVSVFVAGPKGLDPIRGLTRDRLKGGVPLVVGPASAPPAGMLIVSASGPVSVELDALPVGAPGVVVVPAFVLS